MDYDRNNEIKIYKTPIQKFYAGQSILITGIYYTNINEQKDQFYKIIKVIENVYVDVCIIKVKMLKQCSMYDTMTYDTHFIDIRNIYKAR